MAQTRMAGVRCLMLVAGVLALAVVAHAGPVLGVSGGGGAAPAGGGAAPLAAGYVMDQIGPDDSYTQSGGIASQDFETVWDAYDCAFIDDFTVSTYCSVHGVQAVTAGWNGFVDYDDVDGWRVEFYSSSTAASTNLTGDVGSVYVPASDVTVSEAWHSDPLGALVTIPLADGVPLAAGTYWLGVIADLEFEVSGQMGVCESTYAGTPSNANSVFVNPAGGFGVGAHYPVNTDVAYRVTLPEPCTVAVLGLGLSALAARRRRRK